MLFVFVVCYEDAGHYCAECVFHFVQNDINQRNICTKFEVSRSGDFGAAVMTCKL